MKLKDFCPKYFRDQRLPEGGRLVGYAALLHSLDVSVPMRNDPACVSEQSITSSYKLIDGFLVYGKRYWPGERLGDHLEFAMKHEILDMLCLSQILKKVSAESIKSLILDKPNGVYVRRIWFFYEFFLQQNLEVEDLKGVTIQPLLDPQKYFCNSLGPVSKRHRVLNNLLGNKNFCPTIRRTQKLDSAIAKKLNEQAKESITEENSSLVMRAASFLLLADTKASFAIEGEYPPRNRLERWLKTVASAGKNLIDLEELIRLHRILIQDDRFTKIGVRDDEVFLGDRDEFNLPLPEFVGAKKTDLTVLLDGFFETARTLEKSDLDPVLHATALSFGFVYIHPHEDGNGRMHRFLLHHILARRGYTLPGVVFPISSVLLDRIEDYRSVLIKHSGLLMEYIEWEAKERGNVRIKNNTCDFYRYFDCTNAAEFIYECVEYTITHSIPFELNFLKNYDEVLNGIDRVVEMPNERARRLIHYIRENSGKLDKKRRDGEFAQLTDEELKKIEKLVVEYFPLSK